MPLKRDGVNFLVEQRIISQTPILFICYKATFTFGHLFKALNKVWIRSKFVKFCLFHFKQSQKETESACDNNGLGTTNKNTSYTMTN